MAMYIRIRSSIYIFLKIATQLHLMIFFELVPNMKVLEAIPTR